MQGSYVENPSDIVGQHQGFYARVTEGRSRNRRIGCMWKFPFGIYMRGTRHRFICPNETRERHEKSFIFCSSLVAPQDPRLFFHPVWQRLIFSSLMVIGLRKKKKRIVSLTSSISQLHSTPTSHDIMSMGKWIQARSFEVSMDGVVARSVRDKIVICCCRNGAHALKTGTHYILGFSWSYIRPPARSWFDRNMREYSKERISFSL